MAEKLAGQPYKEPPSIEGDMRGLGYDQYRALRQRPDSALWREGKGLFRVEFFPAGFIYEKPVQIFVVDGGTATPVALSTDQFDFSDVGLKTLPQNLTPAGFRLRHPLNRPDKFDEVISFLGASYFRPIGRGQIYGASARGLAIDTAVGKPEEFPHFRTFWLVKPEDGASEMKVWALLDSPGATGAFSFTIRPGARTLVDTKSVLFMRNDISLLGIAPLTSMFFSGKATPARDDYRPEIHDSDGLYVATGKGERIWRPLDNPGALGGSAFQDNNPRGFGLMQRERDFERYRTPARTCMYGRACGSNRSATGATARCGWSRSRRRRRPTTTSWPSGSRAGRPKRASARSMPTGFTPCRTRRRFRRPAATVATRVGAVPNQPKQRRMVVEFAGGELASLEPEQPVTSDVALTNAKVLRTYVEALPWKRGWRLFIDFEPDGKKLVDLRAVLQLRGQTLTETWTGVFRP